MMEYLRGKIRFWTECLCPPKIHVEILTPDVIILGDGGESDCGP